MIFPTPERFLGSDLNGDHDTNDTVLRYQNLETGEVVNTGLIASTAHHSMDIYENIIAFVGENSSIYYCDINTGVVGDTGTPGSHPSIYGSIITFFSHKTIHYFDLSTRALVDTKIKGYTPVIYQDFIVFTAFSPKLTIWTYNLCTGAVADTGATGKNPTNYENIIAFETPEVLVAKDLNGDGDTNDLVIRYYDLETQKITNTGAVGKYPAVYGDRIAFATREWDVTQDLNGDGKILGDVIRYYHLKTCQMVNTRQLGTEPDVYDDTITFYLLERWTGRDLSNDGDKTDAVVDTYQISVTRMVMAGSEIVPFLVFLVILGTIAYFERKK